ncbi:uncharacterized protein [Ptychodera flava]|uniref:uncharacterized protein n=1 Tax=Ptychodera flava TaxID=63121 RepID=UPI00396A048F
MYYTFPNAPLERREAWIKYIKCHVKSWEPKPWSKICNIHFEDFRKSDDSDSKAYVPTVFPKRLTRQKRRREHITGIRRKNVKTENKIRKTVPEQQKTEEMDKSNYDQHLPISMKSSDKEQHLESAGLPDHDYTAAAKRILSKSELEMEEIRVKYPDVYHHIVKIEKENCKLRHNINNLKSCILSLDTIRNNDKETLYWTGYPNYEVFESVFEYLEPKAMNLQYWRGEKETQFGHFYKYENHNKPGPDRKLSLKTEFFLVMVRLKCGLQLHDLAMRFSISEGSVSRIFNTWISFMSREFSTIFTMPTNEDVSDSRCSAFRNYPNTRVVIDCTEIFSETPSAIHAKQQVWSNYKHHNTCKFLVGIGPNGSVNYVSDMWGGRASDKCITKNAIFCNT